jgi:hypothetical protein
MAELAAAPVCPDFLSVAARCEPPSVAPLGLGA